MKKYFSKKELWIYGITFLILFTSGVIWLTLHYFCKSYGEFGMQTHPLESKVLAVHGICGIAFMFIFGAIWEKHAKVRIKNKRKSGKINAILLTAISITVPILYYIGNDYIRNIASILHWVCGVVLLLTLLYHVVIRTSNRHPYGHPSKTSSKNTTDSNNLK